MGISLARSKATLAFCATAGLVLAGAACAPAAATASHISAGCRDGRRVALTFDDGPNAPFTDEILDILIQRHLKATFFVEGQAAEAQPDVIRREASAGMSIGSHSYAHQTNLPDMAGADFRVDLQAAHAALSNILGFEPALYRSPFGHTSDTMLREEARAGYTSIGWDLDSTDWSDASMADIVRTVVDGAHPGAIILMHDGGLSEGNPDRDRTIAALPSIIDGLREHGYEFATIPELTGAPERQGQPRRTACSAN